MPDTIIDARTETPKRFQCRHIFTDGHRCGSACLHHEEFCYYHHTTRKPVASPSQRRSRRATFNLPLPDPNDRSGIQLAIGEVLQRIAANDIDPAAPASSSTASRSPASTSPNLSAKPHPHPNR